MVHVGGLQSTLLHFRIGLIWLFGCSPQQLEHVCQTQYKHIRTADPGGA